MYTPAVKKLIVEVCLVFHWREDEFHLNAGICEGSSLMWTAQWSHDPCQVGVSPPDESQLECTTYQHLYSTSHC